MKLQLIRNATLKIIYAGKTILVDPMFSKKGSFESFAGKQMNPIIDLPFEFNNILTDVDLVLITHTHIDHFDPVAQETIPKHIPFFCQPSDENKIRTCSFKNVIGIEDKIHWKGIEIHRTKGKHGSGEVLKLMGEVSGFILKSHLEPTVYIIGDSILTDDVMKAFKLYNPEIIITNSGGAYMPDYELNPIIMDANQTIKVAQQVPNSKIIAVHLESLDHCTETRKSLFEFAMSKGINQNRLLIPNDGQWIECH